MNHIAKLTMQRDDLRTKLVAIQDELVALEAYYTSSKFAWPDHDYCHVRTDLLPRLSNLKSIAMEG